MKTPEQIAAGRAYEDALVAWSAACDKPCNSRSMLDFRRIAELEAAKEAASERLWAAARPGRRLTEVRREGG